MFTSMVLRKSREDAKNLSCSAGKQKEAISFGTEKKNCLNLIFILYKQCGLEQEIEVPSTLVVSSAKWQKGGPMLSIILNNMYNCFCSRCKCSIAECSIDIRCCLKHSVRMMAGILLTSFCSDTWYGFLNTKGCFSKGNK